MWLPVLASSFDLPVEEAAALQSQLAAQVVTEDRLPPAVRLVAGVDVAYDSETDQMYSAVVIMGSSTLTPVETATAQGHSSFPYVPGLFSFRELPALTLALAKVKQIPDLVICDGHGVAHPRRMGLASHLGLLYDMPTIGCGKTRLIGEALIPGRKRGQQTALIDDGEVIGTVLRTQDDTRPVYVSSGHRVALPTACGWILRLSPRYRLPEPIRAANQVVNELRAAARRERAG